MLASTWQGVGKMLAYSNSLLDYAYSMPREKEGRRKSEGRAKEQRRKDIIETIFS